MAYDLGPAYPEHMTDEVNAWVPGRAGKPVAREPDVAVALRYLADAMENSLSGNEPVSRVLLAGAQRLLGDAAAKTIYAMQVRGELPMPGTRAWDDLMAKAAAGDVEIVTEVRGREHSQPVPPAPREPAEIREPSSLADEMRAMGLM